MIQDSLKVAINEVVEQSTVNSGENTNWWMWLALLELGLISLLVLNQKIGKKNNRKRKLREDSLGQEVNFKNVIESSFHAKAMYDLLKVKCHPDRFPDTEKNVVADALFQEITRNKRNLEKLTELKAEAEKKLSITF